ncbi:MAG: peptidyl-prolyl cis-trans isomerase [Nitrospirota bacterium]
MPLLPACRPKGEAPVARIAGEPVTRAEFEAYLESFPDKGGASALHPDPVSRTVRADRLAEYIERRLFLREAGKQGIRISDEDLAARIGALFSSAPSGANGPGGGQSELEAALAARGMPLEEWKRRVREDMLIERLIARAGAGGADIAEEQMREYFSAHPDLFRRPEQFTVRQIVVADQSLADKMVRRVKEGASFELLAREHSIGPEAAAGGLMGTFSRGDLPSAFEEAILPLKPRQTSGVVKTEFGYHVFKLDGRIPGGMPRFADVRQQVRDLAAAEKREAAFQKWKKNLLESAHVEILDPSLRP